jgi:protein-disulfide isomerase
MLAKALFTTVSGSILLASMIISTSILISGGNLRVKGQTTQKDTNTVAQAAAPIPPQQPAQAQAAAQPNPSAPVKVDISGSPVLGDKNAKLTLVEFSDYECPFCKKSFTELLPELKKNYIDTGKVRLVYKNLPLPFHQNAAKESEAALCAGDQGGNVAYYKYHDQIFTKTTTGGTGIALDQLPVIAEDLGLKVTAFQKCLDSGKFKAQVDKDLAEAQKVGANGTPTWFLGKTTGSDSVEGVIMVGAQPFSVFKTAIDQQLSQN